MHYPYERYDHEDNHPHKKPYEPGPIPYRKSIQWPHEESNWKNKKIKKDPNATPFGRWIKKVQKPHVCLTPTASFVVGLETGSIWECGTCKKQWKLTIYEAKPSFEEHKKTDLYDSAYCVSCKYNISIQDRKTRVSDSGRKMAYGICPNCGTKVNRILGKDDL